MKKEKLESVDDGKLRNRNKKDRSKEEPLEVDGKPGKKKLRSYKSDNVDTGEPNTRNEKARSYETEGGKSNREEEMKKLEAFWKRVGLPNIGHLKGDPPPDEHSKLKGTDKTKCDKKLEQPNRLTRSTAEEIKKMEEQEKEENKQEEEKHKEENSQKDKSGNKSKKAIDKDAEDHDDVSVEKSKPPNKGNKSEITSNSSRKR